MLGAQHHRLPGSAAETTRKRPMNIFDLSGRVAVITGGNGGIGLGIAQALALSGCNVSIWGRNAEKNRSAAATMAAGPGKVETRVCDVSDPASVKDAMAATLDTFGRVDGCFAMPGSAAADDVPSSTAPRRNGAGCLRPILTACSMCSRPRRAT
jgi:NAD(P)-dependent dehydrogenase (short-subunit alcohol dehydrogenase family)